jgi:cytosine/adenosine deaminase-related metal-dependent hydrolase
MSGFMSIPNVPHYIAHNVHVPVHCLRGLDSFESIVDHDGLCAIDIEVLNGTVLSLSAAGSSIKPNPPRVVDFAGSMCWPTFLDLHTHIGIATGMRVYCMILRKCEL